MEKAAQEKMTDGACFDMWQDYLNLGQLLRSLFSGPPQEEPGSPSSASSSPSPPPPALPPRHHHSASASSSSSLSDRSSFGGGPSVFSGCCRFCKQNGESPQVYLSHRLRADDGRVACPILRNYTCPTCGVSGDYAHTLRYCPERGDGAKLVPKFGF